MDYTEVKSKPFLANEQTANLFVTKTNEDDDIKFYPPLYRQRYQLAIEYVRNYASRKVVDMGCAQCKFIWELRNRQDLPYLREIIGVDSDIHLLESCKNAALPLTSEYLYRRDNPLLISLLSGSIAVPDNRLLGTDLFVMIELIEHLDPEILEAVPKTVFHDIRPRFIYLTTPNSEFNILFQNCTGFRHHDHRFEWNREEFMKWCSSVCTSYPWYSVQYFGLGEPPLGFEELGYCTQGAYFSLDENLLPGYLALEKECEVVDDVSADVSMLKNERESLFQNETKTMKENLNNEIEIEPIKIEINQTVTNSITDENLMSTNQKSGNIETVDFKIQSTNEQNPMSGTEMIAVNSKHLPNEKLTNQFQPSATYPVNKNYTEVIRTEFPIKLTYTSPADMLIYELDYYSRQIANHEWNVLTNEEGVCEDDLLSQTIQSNNVYFEPGQKVGIIVGFVDLQHRLCSYPKIREIGDYSIVSNMLQNISDKRMNRAGTHYRIELHIDDNSSEEDRYSDDGYIPDPGEDDDVINGHWVQTGIFVDKTVCTKVPAAYEDDDCWDS